MYKNTCKLPNKYFIIIKYSYVNIIITQRKKPGAARLPCFCSAGTPQQVEWMKSCGRWSPCSPARQPGRIQQAGEGKQWQVNITIITV